MLCPLQMQGCAGGSNTAGIASGGDEDVGKNHGIDTFYIAVHRVKRH